MLRSREVLAVSLAGMLVFGAAARLWAAADDELYRLGEVVVSGGTPIVEAVGVTRRVTAEEMEQRGVRSLDDALNLLPGVDVRVGGDGAPRIDMRGFRTRHIKLLLNGTPFNSTYDGQFDPALISVENIAEIVVTTGATSTLYGSGGNAGVINIITKKGSKGVRGSLNGELASWDTHLLRGTGSYGADKYNVFVSGSHYEQDCYELSDHFSPARLEDGDERENSDRRRDNVFVNVGVTPNDVTSIGATFSYLSGDRGKPYTILTKKDDPFASNPKYEREDDLEEFNVQLALDHDFSGPISVKSWAFFNALDMVEKTYTDATLSKLKSKLDSKVEISGVNLQLACDLQHFGKATLALMAENDDWQAQEKVADTSENEDFQLYSADFEFEARPLQDLGTVFGFGYHWQDRDEKDEEDYSYLVGLYYDLLPGTRLKASHARKVRFPTLRDLYGDEGNADLGGEVTWHYETGVEQNLPAETMFSVTGFYIDVEDFIAKDDATKIRRNFEEYEFKGIEVLVENRYFDKLLLRAGYTYLDTEDKSSDTRRDEIQYNPKHKTTLEATYQLPWQMSIYGSALYVAEAYTYDSNDNKKRMPEYLVCDFRINKKAAGGALDLYFGINNLFDADYEQSYALPRSGRFMYGGVTWKF
ncbi:TonB-dependent receptor plug domain-containing protein [Syntrophotalea acetylenica]|uniref:TonB-dependent receptor n=1 Tax=Syntrophotalea acetylenica TaxID=29542 RepID=A0A1L3GD36_SYNAC|nr:TonB-dependent receptor [Syntrophotalea acetylenica]APG23861.1 hypothetical protein A7E75_01595 [Syntrophotalea acetylenica]APG44442.1 hypothetical protein A6070_10210 [Syntrophotalea acetylenica]